MKIHHNDTPNRFMCGRRVLWNSESSDNLNEVTCETCLEVVHHRSGRSPEYKVGGDFGKDGKRRKFQNQWEYKAQCEAMQKDKDILQVNMDFFISQLDYNKYKEEIDRARRGLHATRTL